MIVLIVLASVLVYLAGFMATARWLAAVDRRPGPSMGEGFIVGCALTWPIAAPILATLATLVWLYDTAVRDAGISRADRRRLKAIEHRAAIAQLEHELGVGDAK